MKVETQIKLAKWIPRPYQLPIVHALEIKGFKRIIACWPRRAGKDVTCFNLAIRQALKRVGTYFYVFPTFSSGRRILWDALQNDGSRVLDYIPPELVESRNEQLMRIRLTNKSVIQIIGSDNYDQTLVGVNAAGIIWSEYAMTDPRSYQFARPILSANDGFALFVSTPRGHNHFFELFEIGRANPQDWFVSKLTIEDTNHISLYEIERERASGEMSEDLIQQEYYTSFDIGIVGSYYTKYIDQLRMKGRIGDVPWEASAKVHTAWDLGMSDDTTIIFFQIIGATVRIIDCYAAYKEGLEHFANILANKPYTYGKHWGPHDLGVKEMGTGISRIEKARALGIKFEYRNVNGQILSSLPMLEIMDGIEAVRSAFSKIWIDQHNCAPLIKALENYRQEWDAKRKVYKGRPLHDQHSHFADAMRYLAISLPKTRDGLSPEDLERRYQEAMMGPNHNMPNVFRDDLPNY